MDQTATYPSTFAGIDGKRIAANSGVIFVHAAALALLLLPGTWSPPLRVAEETVPVIFIENKPEEIPIPPPPPINPVIIRKPVQTAIPQPQIAETVTPDLGPVMDVGGTYAEPVDAGPPVDSFEVGTPQVETLAYDVHPAPRYPRDAIREGRTGTVMLRVLVDEAGQPQEVTIERGSGHRDLDRAARDQVLARWRFHPAQRMGRNVSAYALVPVAFNLPR